MSRGGIQSDEITYEYLRKRTPPKGDQLKSKIEIWNKLADKNAIFDQEIHLMHLRFIRC